MKTISPQFDLPGTEHVFNLSGEVIRQDEPDPTPVPDTQTPDLWDKVHSAVVQLVISKP